MGSQVSLLGIAAVLFASTNVDDVFVLIGFCADPKFRAREIVLGQYVGIAVLFVVSVVASLLSLVFPRAYVGLLGFVPILIGGKKVINLGSKTEVVGDSLEKHADSGDHGRTATVALVTITNGGDNIGIYTPSFAIRSAHEIAALAIVFAALTGFGAPLHT